MSVKTAPNRPRRKPQPGAIRETHHLSLWGPLHGIGVLRVLGHLIREMGRTNVSLLASALAFYGLLATFPALVGVITSFGLLANPAYVSWVMSGLHGIMPEEAWGLVAAELKALVGAPNPQIGAGLIVGLVIALWSSHSAAASVMEALNRIYRTHEERSIVLHTGPMGERKTRGIYNACARKQQPIALELVIAKSAAGFANSVGVVYRVENESRFGHAIPLATAATVCIHGVQCGR